MGFPPSRRDNWNELCAFVIQVLITIDSISFFTEDGVSIRPPVGTLRQFVREPDTRNGTPFTALEHGLFDVPTIPSANV